MYLTKILNITILNVRKFLVTERYNYNKNNKIKLLHVNKAQHSLERKIKILKRSFSCKKPSRCCWKNVNFGTM